jgi:hypothetical protein
VSHTPVFEGAMSLVGYHPTKRVHIGSVQATQEQKGMFGVMVCLNPEYLQRKEHPAMFQAWSLQSLFCIGTGRISKYCNFQAHFP